ncbi:Hypothetical protein Cp106_0209 [Corynebacterium pseudotuberculosis 1/06-A]|nr:Hypothetical protein Cp106_0209 [Corynebacterium pseudotuberculosis 1/06-A]
MLQVLAEASFNEKEILRWTEKGKKVNHEIWYEEIPLDKSSHSSGLPGEILVYFIGCSFNEGWDQDFHTTVA